MTRKTWEHGSTSRRSVPAVTAWRRVSTSIRTPTKSQNVVAVISAITTATPGAGRRSELLADTVSVGHVDLGGERDDDRLGLSRVHGLGLRHGDHLR